MPEKSVTYTIEAAVKTAASIKKDKTSEAVIEKMMETNKQNRNGCRSSRIKTLKPVTLYRGGEKKKDNRYTAFAGRACFMTFASQMSCRQSPSPQADKSASDKGPADSRIPSYSTG